MFWWRAATTFRLRVDELPRPSVKRADVIEAA
jgi:hypothetical protein